MSDGMSEPVLGGPRDAVIAINENREVVDLNHTAEEMFGFARAEALERPIDELIVPPQLRSDYKGGLERALSSDPAEVLDRRVQLTARRADGSRFPAEMTVTAAVRDPRARFTAWIRDLTEQETARADAERRQVLLDRAERVASIGSWQWTPEKRELLWSYNLFRIFGLEPGQITPSPKFVFERTHPDDRDRVERAVARLELEGRLAALDYRIVRSDRAVHHLRATIATAEQRVGEPQVLVGSVQDMTEQLRAEREIAGRGAVTEALHAWDGIDSGGERLLRKLGQAMDFVAGAIWLPREHGGLSARVYWQEDSVEASAFEAATRQLIIHPGEGLPGRAWQEGEPLILRSVDEDPEYLRRDPAAAAGLRGALAVPANLHGEVLAVVELYSYGDEWLDEPPTRSLSSLSRELGAFLDRHRGELGPSPLTPREIEVLQRAAWGSSLRAIADELFVSPSTIRTHFANIYRKLGVSDRAAAVAHAMRSGLIE
jgi:PAS domain S-box-containing protein